MAKITDIAIHELSLIFGEHKGEKWLPVNGDARVLALKGAPDADTQSKFARLVDAVKAAMGFPVTSEVADDVDGDGDGADDYNELVPHFGKVASDIQTACGIQDDDARSGAVKTAIDNFFKNTDAARGKSAKAGKRHSASDQVHIDAIASAQAKGKKAMSSMQKTADAIDEHLKALGPDTSLDKGNPVVETDAVKALVEEFEKADGGKYGDVEYADTKNKKYPIDTEEHARAAWSYINQEKNAAKYDSDELAAIKSRIKAACKKFGIDIESDKGAPVANDAPPASTIDQASVDEAIVKAVATARGEIESAFKVQLEESVSSAVSAVKAEADGKIATLETSLTEAHNLLKAMVGDAKKPGSPGMTRTMNSDGSYSDPGDPTGEVAKAQAAAEIKSDKSLTPIGAAVKLARITN
jgi:hypothetical protein